jgi:hypothetical protein
VGALHVASSTAEAQLPVGGFDDASLPGRWQARLRIATILDGTIDQFGGIDGTGSGRVPLGARLSFDSLGAKQLPAVARAERLLRDSVGVSVGLTLGTVHTDARTLVTRVPLRLDVGVTRRIAIGVTVPLVQTRQSLNLRVNPGGATGDLGFNPANADASGSADATALGKNKAVQDQLVAAAKSLDSIVANCPTSGTNVPSACTNRTGATQLANQARSIATALAQLYGTGTSNPGALFVPIAGTVADSAVQNRLRAIAAQFTAFQVSTLSTPLFPAGATARISNAGFQRIVTEEPFGVLADTVRGAYRSGIGDVEIDGSIMWLDTFRAVGSSAPLPRLRMRSTATVGYRLATGSLDLPFELFDVPTGSGAPALLLRSATDLALGRRFVASAVARVEYPFTKELFTRIPVTAGDLLVPVSREQLVDRQLGRQVALEVSPRWLPNDAFAFAAHYAFRSKQADKYTGTFTSTDTTGGATAGSYDASILGVGTGGRAQTMGLGITYSTLSAYARGHAWVPAEVSYLHTAVFSGSGGVVPRVRSDQLVLRLYTQRSLRGARR